jgi:hypothetical protein
MGLLLDSKKQEDEGQPDERKLELGGPFLRLIATELIVGHFHTANYLRGRSDVGYCPPKHSSTG